MAGLVGAVMRSGLFADARIHTGGKLELAFYERLLVHARLALPREQWPWLRAAELDECGWVDLELGPPNQPARAVVALKAVAGREVIAALGRMVGNNLAPGVAVELPSWVDEQVASMDDVELVSAVPALARELKAATTHVSRYGEAKRDSSNGRHAATKEVCGCDDHTDQGRGARSG